MKLVTQSAILAALLACNPAWAADRKIHTETDVQRDDRGNYEGTSRYEDTDAAGTSHSSTIKESESNTFGGGVKRTKTVDKETDPKGLMNKSWSKAESETKVSADGSIRKEDRAKSVDAAGTRRDLKETAKTKINADGSSQTTVARSATTDPKGLLNKSTSKTQETVTRAANGEVIGHTGDLNPGSATR